MTSTYDDNGVVYDKYADIVTDMSAKAVELLGESINLDQDSAYGHFMQIVAETEAIANEIDQDVFDAGSVENSSGTTLAGNVAFVGVERSGFSYSTISSVQLTATKAVTVPANTRYGTATNVIFETDEELVITGAGTGTVSCTCTVAGPFDVAIGELNLIKSSVNGISAVTNLTAAVPGVKRQTDAQLKETHTITVATSGENDSAGIYQALYEIPVTKALVVDNDTDAIVDTVPANTIRVIVIGGEDEDVANAIWNNKTTGVPTFGSESYECYDSTYGQTKTIYFDRGATEPVDIAINITKQGNFPSDGENTIKEAFATIFDSYTLGSTVIYNQCISAVFSVVGVQLNSITVDSGTADVTMTAIQLPSLDIERDSSDRITAINVTITVA